MTSKNKNLKTLNQFIDEKISKNGTENREQFETEYDAFKLERNLQDIRFSTLQRIITEDLGGQLDISIRLK